MKHAVLLINLGTPQKPDTKHVRKYLREFLGDPRVLNLPKILKFLFLQGFILPFRPYKTAKAYQKIWNASKGSPLFWYSQQLTQKLQTYLKDDCKVALGMRYGEPNLKMVLTSLVQDVEKLTIIPLYPQYASSTTGSALELCFDLLKKLNNIPTVEVIHDFFSKPWYLDAVTKVAKPYLQHSMPDHVLFSFHGLPIRHIQQSEKQVCGQTLDCPPLQRENRFCYRAQCFAMSKMLAHQLGFAHNYSVAFQSRIGKIAWVQPYLENHIKVLAKKGVKRLCIICPSFVTDCLETLEEIDLRLSKMWYKLTGEVLELIPCLNDNDIWVTNLANFIRQRNLDVSQVMFDIAPPQDSVLIGKLR